MISFFKDENGQGMLEYVLIIALVAVVVLGAILLMNKFSKNAENSASNKIDSANEVLTN